MRPNKGQSVQHLYFPKKTFTMKSFRVEIRRFYRHRHKMIETFRSGRLSRPFIERIMMAITAVNRCVYCSYVHTRLALEQSCTEAEIHNIMNFNFEGMCEDEVVALTFAQHYAESNRHPSREAMRRLIDYYGPTKSRDIYHIICAIYFGNLLGNTIDGFESRLHGYPPKNGDLRIELLVYLLGGLLFSRIVRHLARKAAT
jgi:AhpD family alkylhydroperoxidase